MKNQRKTNPSGRWTQARKPKSKKTSNAAKREQYELSRAPRPTRLAGVAANKASRPCPCGKRVYRDHREAVDALHQIAVKRDRQTQMGIATRRHEKRDYTCDLCGSLHLTSWEQPGPVRRDQAAKPRRNNSAGQQRNAGIAGQRPGARKAASPARANSAKAQRRPQRGDYDLSA